MAKARIAVDFSRFSAGLRSFIEERTAEAVAHGMNVIIRRGQRVRCDTGMCGGTCCELELRVAWAGINCVGNVVHEFCHAEQIIHAPKLWKSTMVRGRDSSTLIDDWIRGKVQLSRDRLDNYFRRLVTLERDCERRVLKNADAYDITEIDRRAYTMDANAYLEFHAVVMRNQRRWHRPSEYCSNAESLARVPHDRLFTVKEIMAMMA